ncbi:MAG TPA: hypothetical protein VL096_13710, partial [Pirellulaceae bacterium]|nr:hypothetical protein [Pirellulaceae bacterium]
MVLLTLILCSLSAVAEAGVGETFFLPRNGKKPKNFATVILEAQGASGIGYRPVKVTIVNLPAGPAIRDRDFRVVLRPYSVGSVEQDVTVQEIVEMPEGTTSGSAWISVPQVEPWVSLAIEVYEGGVRLNDLSDNLGFNNVSRGSMPGNEDAPAALFIDADAPAREEREKIVIQQRNGIKIEPTHRLPQAQMWQRLVPMPSYRYGNYPSTYQGPGAAIAPTVESNNEQAPDSEILRHVADNEKMELLSPAELPAGWLNYTCYDLIFISLADAEALAKQQPQRWRDIGDWCASGTTLIITGVGEDLERRKQVEKLLAMPPAVEGDLADKHFTGWQPADPSFAVYQLRALQGRYDPSYNPGGQPVVIEPTDIPIDPADGERFAIRSFGLGRVAAVAADDPLAPPANDLFWLMNQLEGRTWINVQRTGVSQTNENGDFIGFLVEGTGRVPVYSFLVFISLFSIVIGPVNYLLLKRKRRLYMLLVTVPLGALLVTLGLFGYAIVSDGLGMQMRARSFTRLDQTNQRLAQWSRQSYYGGLAPSGGLSFPKDTAVYPIEEKPSGGGNQREVVWNDNQQLRSGYISSRRTAQFLVQRSSASEVRLKVDLDGSNAPQVTNELGSKIVRLALRDLEGNYFSGRDIAP